MAAMVVRVAANIAELRTNLKEGVSQIETTTAAMQKMAASFSGDKLLQSAQNVTAAVNSIGGASKLTETEMARVNSTLERALEKYRLLGKEAPAGMQKLADETKGADKASSGLTDTVKSLALGFAAMFTARAAFNFIKSTVDEAGALKDLSTQTRISVEDLQVMAGGMSEFGVGADELGKAVYKLSKGIAGGDESVAHGLHLMGLSLKDVAGLEGRELFLKIEDGLSKLQGGLRDTAASELYGSKLGAAMAGASEGIAGTIEQWEKLNTVASTASVDALDAFGEAIARTQTSLEAMATNMIGPVAEGFNHLYTAATHGATKFQILGAMSDDLFDKLLKGGTGTKYLSELMDDLNQKTEAGAKHTRDAAGASGERVVAVTKEQAAVAFMASVEADAAVKLTAIQVTQLEHLKEIGALNAKNAAGIGVTGAAYAKYVSDIAAATAAEKLEQTAVDNLVAAYDKLHLLTISNDKKIVAQTAKENAEWAKIVNDAIVKEFEAQVKLNKAMGLDASGAIAVQASALETLRIKLADLEKQEQRGISQVAQKTVAADELRDALLEDAKAYDAANLAAGTFHGSLERGAAIAKGSAQSFDGLRVSIQATNEQMAAYYNDVAQHNSAGSIGGKGNDNIGVPVILGNTAQVRNSTRGFAAGGPTTEGLAYVHDNEYVVPSGGALITRGGGGASSKSVNNYYITQPFGTPSEIAAAVDRMLTDRQRDIGTRF